MVGNVPNSGFSQNQVLTNYAATDPNIPSGGLEAIADQTHLTFNSPPSPFYDLTGISTSITLDGSALLTQCGFAGAVLAPLYSGTGSVVRFHGLISEPTITSGAVDQFMAAGYFINSNFGGTVTSMMSVYADSPLLFGGTTTNSYGVYIEDQSIVGATNAWNIWSNGTGSDNHFEGKITALGRVSAGSLGVGNSVAATTLGSVVKKIEVFDAAGTSLGFIAVYDSIS